MQSLWYAWLVTILGVLLLLPALGVTALGNLNSGVLSWLIPVIVIVIGVIGIFKANKK